MSRRKRIGSHKLTRKQALRFEVVRGVLLRTLSLYEGARLLRTSLGELGRLVEGARAAVIRELGPDALERAREPERLAG